MKDIKHNAPITIAEVRDIFSRMDIDQLDQIQRWTFDYTSRFTSISREQSNRMKSRLMDECSLTEEEAVEIINIMPNSIAEVRSFTFGWKKLILAETLAKILDILTEESQTPEE